jgi:hypothetical protein
MKNLRMLAVVAVLVFLALSAGCDKSYFFNFKTETDLIREDGTWVTYDTNYELSSDGLFMENCWAAVPHVYTGNLTAIVSFSLNATASSDIYMEAYLSETAGFMGSAGCAGIRFIDLGSPTANYVIWNYNDSDGYNQIYSNISPIPGIVNDGINELRIIKVGDALTFKLNGVTIVSNVVPPLYESDLSGLTVMSQQDASRKDMYYRSVKIIYSGEQTLL